MGNCLAYLFMLVGLTREDDGTQRKRLLEHGCRVIEDNFTGALNRLASGDTLVVTSLDRLALKTAEFYPFLRDLLGKRRADLRALDERFDTGGPFHEHLLTLFVAIDKADSAFAAEKRRKFIAKLKTYGKQGGRPPRLSRERFLRGYHLVKTKQVNERSLIFLFGVSRATYYRWKKKVLSTPSTK